MKGSVVLLKRFYHEGLAQASYLVGCQQTGEAVVIDANRDPEPYVAAATENGLRVTHVTETHIHADYLSGSRELAHHTGAQLLLSAEGGAEWQYAFAREASAMLLRDGDRFMVGQVRVDVMHTPGHTPEHLSFIITDTEASDRPLGAFTGDFIFVGDVGRPDLLERAANVQGTMRAGAAQLFHSIARFVARFPDYLQLWPGHGAGSACGKSLGAVPQTTLGYEKLVNWGLQPQDAGTFVEAVLHGQPDPPVYFATMKRLNREGPALLGARPAPTHRAAPDLDRILAEDALIIDIRRAEQYAAGFVPGTLSIPLNRSFLGWAGWLVPYDRDIYLLTDAEDDVSARSAAAELAMIGLDRVMGWFGADAFATWKWRNRALDRVPQMTPDELAVAMKSDSVVIVDVRAESEWEAGHIPGAHSAPLGRMLERLPALPEGKRVVLTCQGGGRSSIAASLLRARGLAAGENLQGGLTAWEQQGLPVTRDGVSSAAG